MKKATTKKHKDLAKKKVEIKFFFLKKCLARKKESKREEGRQRE